MRWSVLIPLKPVHIAKSRLRTGPVDDRSTATGAPNSPLSIDHESLVLALAADTAAAAVSARSVARVVLITDAATAAAIGIPGLLVVPDPRAADHPDLVDLSALNRALTVGARWAIDNFPVDGVVALTGDLPALTGPVLDDVLQQAAHATRGFVPDAAGTGTAMLTAMPGVELAPHFGEGSAAAHTGSGATALDAPPRARQDVDTTTDLQAAARIGLGPRTSAVMAVRTNPSR